jgi:hypothetical protein
MVSKQICGAKMECTYAVRCGSGIEDWTALISEGPKPVAVLLCFGREKAGPTGPCRSDRGAEVEGFLSLRDKEGRLSNFGCESRSSDMIGELNWAVEKVKGLKRTKTRGR